MLKESSSSHTRRIEFIPEKAKLEYHMKQYFLNKQKQEKCLKNYNEIEDIRDFFSQNKVKMTKLNHSLDLSTQRFTQFQSYMQLSANNEFIEIVNKKPVEQEMKLISIDPKNLKELQY